MIDRTAHGLAGALLAASLSFGASVPALAADPITGLDTPVVIKAREQPVAKFIRELFGQMGVPVKVDDGVRGAVNGDFDKPAGDVLEELRKAFQLTYYYDGAVLHVYSASDLTRDIMYLPRNVGDQVLENAEALSLMDRENRLESASVGLVATGTARFLEQVRELADAVENKSAASGAPETFRVFKLEYGWADDVSLVVGGQTVVVPGVASLLAKLVGADGIGIDASGAEDTGGVRRAPTPPTRPPLKGQGLQSVGALEALPGRELDEVPAAVTTLPARDGATRARIVADPLNNAVVIRDRADRMANYERLIDTLDVEPLMVEIEATIIDMNTDRLRQLGIEWRLQSGQSNPIVDAATPGGVTPIGDGGVVSLVLGDRTRFMSRIRALENQGAARIVSRPHVITLANVEAVLDSTSTFFVRVEGQEEVDLFDVSVGTTMRVTPHVLESRGQRRIKLLVGIEDGNTSDQRVDRIPVIERSTINTQALVAEGQSLLIGGLIRETEQSSVSKVPLLGDLPGIGALFRSNSMSSRQKERLFLITPRLTVQGGPGDGLRLDVPILSGDEGDIIRSAPIRLEAARAALAERDAAFPLKRGLPGAARDVELGSGEPLLPRERRPAPIRLERAPVPEGDETSPAGERGRVLSVADRASDGTTDRGGIVADGEDGWSEVPGSRPTRP